MKKYTIKESTIGSLKEFIKPAVEIYDSLDKEKEFSTDEVNLLLTYLGKFPAAMVYSLIEELKNGLIEISEKE